MNETIGLIIVIGIWMWAFLLREDIKDIKEIVKEIEKRRIK